MLVLGCPAKDEFDELGLGMMQRLLPAGKCQVELLSKATLAGEMLAQVAEAKPAVLVIGAVPPYSFAAIRYLCKRTRAQFPTVKILVGCWGMREEAKAAVGRLLSAGADFASADLLETRTLLLPLIHDAAVVRLRKNRRRRKWFALRRVIRPKSFSAPRGVVANARVGIMVFEILQRRRGRFRGRAALDESKNRRAANSRIRIF